MRGRLRKILFLVAVISLTIAATPMAGADDFDDADIEASVVLGLEWLAAQQNPNGSFGDWDDLDAHTGLAVLKFEDRAIDLGLDPLEPAYQYSDVVIAGLGYLEGTVQLDANGVFWGFWGHEVYSTGIVMMAFSASGHPELYTHWVLDGLSWMVWAQADVECGVHYGGWRYGPDGCDSDNSISGYATLGLGFASAAPPFGFDLTVPPATLIALDAWIGVIQNPVDGDANDGGSYYTPGGSWENILKTGNLLYEMGLVGDTADTPRVQDAVAFIERHWGDGTDPGWMGDYQAMFTMMKGLESLGIENLNLDSGVVADDPWFPIVAQYIIDTQNADGSWPAGGWGDEILNTSWALLTLEKAVPEFDIPVPVDIKPTSCRNPFNVDQKGTTPVAILGTENFDVTMIDPITVALEGVAPLRWAYEDVATPFVPFIGKVDPFHCTEEGPDGFMDFTMKFKSQELAIAIGAVEDGDVLTLHLTGNLLEEFGGTLIFGEDVIVILKKK